MVKIIETAELPLGDKVYLKKDFLGWRVVEPIKDPETGKWIWKNFFSLRSFIWLGVLLLVLGVLYLAFREQLINYKMVLENPCRFCKSCIRSSSEFLLNTTNFNLTF